MKIIIIGCTVAGLSAALELGKTHPESDVTIYERTQNLSFMPDSLFLYFRHEIKSLDDGFAIHRQQLVDSGIKVCDHHNIVSVDVNHQSLRGVDMLSGEPFTDHYDKLVLATGSNVRLPPIAGIDHPHVLLCKNYLQLKKLVQSLQQPQRVGIVGGGYIGVELAESLSYHHHTVHLFQSHDTLLNNYFDVKLSNQVTDLLNQHHVQVHLQTELTDITETRPNHLTVTTQRHRQYEFDYLVICTGFVPNTDLVARQLVQDRHGALILSRYLQTSDSHVYAAGDCATVDFNPDG